MPHITLTDNRPVPARYKYPDIILDSPDLIDYDSEGYLLLSSLPGFCVIHHTLAKDGNHATRRKAFREAEIKAGRGKKKPKSRYATDTLNLTTEYNRVRDIIFNVSEFHSPAVLSYGYKSPDDLASEIFLNLFERKFWDKWDPKRSALSTYTFMGVRSLVYNQTLSTKRLRNAVAKDPVRAPDFIYPAHEDDGDTDEVVRDIVSPYNPHEQSITDAVLAEQFKQYLTTLPNQPEGGITYPQIFEQLTSTSPSETRHALITKLAGEDVEGLPDNEKRKRKAFARAKVSQLLTAVQESFKDFLGWDNDESFPEWAC